jgi:hypothetical protein
MIFPHYWGHAETLWLPQIAPHTHIFTTNAVDIHIFSFETFSSRAKKGLT